MKLFISDLDNTMIYSYKKDIGMNKVLVETKDGKALSYMTRKSYDLLNDVRNQYHFIPSTTRSLEQYLRISLNNNWLPEYALVSNGGNLLYNNKIDEGWYANSLKLIENAQGELFKAIEILSHDKQVIFDVRRVDGLFVFTKSDDVNYSMENLKELLDLNVVDVFNNGSKVYVLPKSLNKGMAIRRIKELTGIEYVVCAGDSEFDIPMLLEADLAFIPQDLDNELMKEQTNKIISGSSAIFSDEILTKLLHLEKNDDVFLKELF